MAQERAFDRLVNFSDAVVAIAATLLILPLVDKAAAIGQTPVPEFLAQNTLSFVVFVLSFVVIGRFWLSHHRFFDHLKSFTPGLLIFNLLWLLGIVFLPFPTELIVSGQKVTSAAAEVYLGTMAFIALSSLGMAIVVRRNNAIVHDAKGANKNFYLALITSIVMVVALLISLAWPMVGLWSLWLLLLTPIASRIIDRRYAQSVR